MSSSNDHKKAALNRIRPIHPIRRVAGIVAGLAGALLACAAALAAQTGIRSVTAGPPFLGPRHAGNRPATVQIHTIITGGMPGWQITVIAATAAILTAATAVILDRARTARRNLTAPTA